MQRKAKRGSDSSPSARIARQVLFYEQEGAALESRRRKVTKGKLFFPLSSFLLPPKALL
jgi:hypothetical protein